VFGLRTETREMSMINFSGNAMSQQTVTAARFDESGDAFNFATRKARYGHRDWVVYPLRQGGWIAEAKTAGVVKSAMLQVGTAGKFFMYLASNATPMRMSWRLGLIQIANASVGVY
jgi:hypothetical protein